MLEPHPRLKRFLHYLLTHPCTTYPRRWAYTFAIPLVIKRGKDSIIRRKARLDIIPFRKITIGVKGIIKDHAIINNGMGDVIIGDYTHVTPRVKLVGPVTLGNYVTLGSNVQIIGLTHNYLDVTCPIAKQGVTPNRTIIEDDVWIGDNSCINQGTTIGTHCIVTAGNVVTKPVLPYLVADGSPACILKLYDFEEQEWIKTSKK